MFSGHMVMEPTTWLQNMCKYIIIVASYNKDQFVVAEQSSSLDPCSDVVSSRVLVRIMVMTLGRREFTRSLHNNVDVFHYFQLLDLHSYDRWWESPASSSWWNPRNVSLGPRVSQSEVTSSYTRIRGKNVFLMTMTRGSLSNRCGGEVHSEKSPGSTQPKIVVRPIFYLPPR